MVAHCFLRGDGELTARNKTEKQVNATEVTNKIYIYVVYKLAHLLA